MICGTKYVRNFRPAMQPATHTSKRTGQQKRLDAFYKYCFAVIFSLSLVGEYSLSLFLSHHKAPAAAGKQIALSTPADNSDFPLEFPKGTEPDQLEMPEDGPEAQSHDVCVLSAVLEGTLHFSTQKSSFLNFTSYIENREPVSLIVLHHSWKSFLS